MLFNFSPTIEAGIEAGKYAQVFSNGVPISMARDAVTGKFVAHAVAATVDGNPLSPLISPFQFVTKGANIIQTHMGFQETYQQIGALQSGLQTLQNSVGVLQATTALIGVGTVASVALGAVNLQQASDLAIANLYHYFKIRDESEIIDNSEEEELGIYTKLCDLLATENWQEADNETAEIIFQLSKQEYKMSSEYANNVSADDFRIIDKLWLKYSKGRFGFSVQKRIWQEESEESDKLGEFDNNKIYARFCEAVGWRVINGCLLSSYLNFTLNAPLGHFPVAVAGQGWSAASFLESLTWKL